MGRYPVPANKQIKFQANGTYNGVQLAWMKGRIEIL